MVQVAAERGYRACRCRVGEQVFAVDLTGVRGVERADRMVRSGAGGPVVGELPDRAGPVPVLSLAGLLGVDAPPPGPAAQLLTADTPDGPVAFLVDNITRVFEAARRDVVGMPRLVGDTGFPAVLRTADELLLWVDPVALVGGRPGPRADRAGTRRAAGADRTGQVLFLPLTDPAGPGRPWAAVVPAGRVDEVVTPGRIVPVPGGRPFVAGVTRWRDRVIPVADLASWLGLVGVPPGDGSRVVVVSPPGSGGPVGLLVRGGVRAVKLPVPHVRSGRPFPGDATAVSAVIEVGAVRAGVLDLAALLA